MRKRIFAFVLSCLMTGSTVMSVAAESIPEQDYDPAEVESYVHDDCTDEDHEHDNSVKVAVFDTGISDADIPVVDSVSFVGNDSISINHGNNMSKVLYSYAPDAEIYDVRVLDNNGEGKYSDVAKAVDWSIENDIDVIAMSFAGNEESAILQNAVKKAENNDILVIASAGNTDGEEKMTFPAAYDSVVSVGALKSDFSFADYSNYGKYVDTYAYEEMFDGTSASAQNVVGKAVEMLSEGMTVSQVRESLTAESVKPVVKTSSKNVDGKVYAACSHKYTPYYTSKAATCTSNGSKYKFCYKCGHKITKSISATGHSISSYTISVPPTCTMSGKEKGYCSRCKKYIERSVNAKGHNYVAKTVAPTCTKDGYTEMKCSRCSASKSRSAISAVGHYVKKYTISVPPTCTASGKEYGYCTRCSKKLERTVKAKGHNYVAKTVAPTCTKGGYTQMKCSRCSALGKKSTTSALGHSAKKYTISVPPTCTASGKEYGYCTRCSKKLERTVKAKGHNYVPKTVAPTCTKSGYTQMKCSRCTASYQTSSKSPLGHSAKKYTISVPPTCTASGKEYGYCTRCSKKLERTVKAKGHNYVPKTVAPTCTKSGYTQMKCSRCTASYQTSSKPALGHSISKYTITVPPTCTASGKEKGYCSRCKKYIERTVKPKSHVYDSKVITVAATCTKDGYTKQNCKYCSAYKKLSTIKKLGHVYGAYYVTKEPTLTAEGVETSKCQRKGCNGTRTQKIAKLKLEYDNCPPSDSQYYYEADGNCRTYVTPSYKNRTCAGFNFKSNRKVTITSNCSWIKVVTMAKTSSMGNAPLIDDNSAKAGKTFNGDAHKMYAVAISVDPYTTRTIDNRSGTVTIKTGGYTKVLKVSQAAPYQIGGPGHYSKLPDDIRNAIPAKDVAYFKGLKDTNGIVFGQITLAGVKEYYAVQSYKEYNYLKVKYIFYKFVSGSTGVTNGHNLQLIVDIAEGMHIEGNSNPLVSVSTTGNLSISADCNVYINSTDPVAIERGRIVNGIKSVLGIVGDAASLAGIEFGGPVISLAVEKGVDFVISGIGDAYINYNSKSANVFEITGGGSKSMAFKISKARSQFTKQNDGFQIIYSASGFYSAKVSFTVVSGKTSQSKSYTF